MIRELVFIVAGLACVSGAIADQVSDAATEEVGQFLEAKPLVKEYKPGNASLVDAWERTMGLTKMAWLKYDGSIPPQWTPQLHKRISAIQQISFVIDEDNRAGEMLEAMLNMYADMTVSFLRGDVRYNDWMLVANFVEGKGQHYAEELRGKPYDDWVCKWGDDDCVPPKKIWAQ